MVTISEKELAILGMLLTKPRHGYEIEKEIEETSMREWTDFSFSSIYLVLKKLGAKNFVEQKVEMNQKDQARKVYHITDAGREAAVTKLREILSTHEKVIWRMDLGLAYLNLLPPAEVEDCLQKYQTSIETLIKGYHDLLKYLTEQQCSFHRLELANRSIALLQAEKRWVQEFIEKVRKSIT